MAHRLARVERAPFVVGNPLPSIISVAALTAALGGILAYQAGWTGTHVIAGLVGYATVGVVVAAAVGLGHGYNGFGVANQVTLLRAGLVCLAGSALMPGGASSISGWSLVGLVAAALSLDAVDGWLARRLRVASGFGARFDLEIDALLILILALLVWRTGAVGPWVLAIGLMRYVFVVASWLFPTLRQPLPPSWRRQAVCVQQGITLLMCLLPSIGSLLANVSAGLALLALLASFAADLIYLVRVSGTLTTIDGVDRRTHRAILLSTADSRDPQMCGNRT